MIFNLSLLSRGLLYWGTNCITGRLTKSLRVKLSIFSYLSVLTYVLDAQKNRLIETVL